MIRKGLVTAVAIGAAFLAQPAAAQANTLAPAGDWQISEDDESCTLQRDFSAAAEGDTTLYIRSYGPRAASQVSITGPTMVRDNSAATTAQISFGDAEPDGDVAAIARSFRDQPMLVFQLAAPRPANALPNYFGRGRFDDYLRMAATLDVNAETMTVATDGMERQTLQIGATSDALNTLFECEGRLLEKWGFDPVAEANLSQAPKLNNGERMVYWIIYPSNFVINHVSQIAQFRVRVSENGEVEDCVIQAPSWERRNLRQSCQAITQGAEFTPALDADGNPVSALWRASMIFILFD